MPETDGKRVSAGEAFIYTEGTGNNSMLFKDTLGVLFLGILALILIIALERAHARNRQLMNQLVQNRS